ncbi:MAG: hypothetical protein IT495_21605 [Gammaproteobacteria bacterium]|nr:hypothetical protein [Gammaproteobacteria bacterium]
MTRRFWTTCTLFGVLLSAAAATTAADTAPSGRPDLSGDWVVDAAQSDEPSQAIKKSISRRERDEMRERAEARERDGDGRERGGAEAYDGAEPFGDPNRAKLEFVGLLASKHIVIRQMEPEFRFQYDSGYERVFYNDRRGRVVSATTPRTDTGFGYSSAYWDGATLVIESQPPGGGRTVERYTLSADGARLELQVKLRPVILPHSVELSRVYTRAGVDPGAAPAAGRVD